jgi:hypothetical protein
MDRREEQAGHDDAEGENVKTGSNPPFFLYTKKESKNVLKLI